MRMAFLVLAAALAFVSCDPEDCLFNRRPALEEKELEDAIRAQSYYETIAVDVRNGVGSYGITSIEVSGDLPTGLDVDSNGMNLVISGVPISNGRSDFRIRIEVTSYDQDEDGSGNLCSDMAERGYSILVD